MKKILTLLLLLSTIAAGVHAGEPSATPSVNPADPAVPAPASESELARLSSEVDARAYIAAHPELRLYHRISDFMKCRHYCECAPFCDQWKENMFLDCVKEDVTDEPFIPF